MKLVPAIDLMDGRCVRLAQGDFTRVTAYPDDPRAALTAFAEAGADEAHIVDLDGARAREPRQHDLFFELAAVAPIGLQVAGGFRTEHQVERALSSGVERVVLGSLAVIDPAGFAVMLERFGPDRLTLALDVRIVDAVPMVVSHGWQEESGRALHDVLGLFPSVRHLLVTDIARDGMKNSPNLELTRSICEAYPAIELQASGGVADIDDLAALRRIGAARAIVGKAIWDGNFTVAEGIAHARG